MTRQMTAMMHQLLLALVALCLCLTNVVNVGYVHGFTMFDRSPRHRRVPSLISTSSNVMPTILKMNKKDNNNDNDDGTWVSENKSNDDGSRRNLIINTVAAGLLAASGVATYSLFQTSVYTPSGFTRLPNTQFIAALGDPSASEGKIDTTTSPWGIWALDPGPRGVWLRDYNPSMTVAPAGWKYDPNNWWLEEHGLIMESPYFPIPAGRYLVTGGRMVTTGLTITDDGRWKLDSGTLYDVTHLPCRSARYQPQSSLSPSSSSKDGTPLAANPRDFPVTPGAEMPAVPGTIKKDYAVLFVVGKAER